MSLEHLKLHLFKKVVILGIGNALRSDDAAGSLLAARLKDRVPYIVYDSGTSPENYLGKIIKDGPDNIIIIDAADFGGCPGELCVFESHDLKVTNLFSTHNSSASLVINYLQNNLKADIIILTIQPKNTSFGDNVSPEVQNSLKKLELWFYDTAKEKR